MTETPEWLPSLIKLEEYGGDWETYLNAVYESFWRDFISTKPYFSGFPVGHLSSQVKGKAITFWHIISEGEKEEERQIDLRRCERIRWPRPIIEAAKTGKIKYWPAKRQGGERVVLALEDISYVVILGIGKSHYMLLTAYCVDEHRRIQLLKEYNRSKKS